MVAMVLTVFAVMTVVAMVMMVIPIVIAVIILHCQIKNPGKGGNNNAVFQHRHGQIYQ